MAISAAVPVPHLPALVESVDGLMHQVVLVAGHGWRYLAEGIESSEPLPQPGHDRHAGASTQHARAGANGLPAAGLPIVRARQVHPGRRGERAALAKHTVNDPGAVSMVKECVAQADRAALRNAVISISLRRQDLTPVLPQVRIPTFFLTGTEHSGWTPDQARVACQLLPAGAGPQSPTRRTCRLWRPGRRRLGLFGTSGSPRRRCPLRRPESVDCDRLPLDVPGADRLPRRGSTKDRDFDLGGGRSGPDADRAGTARSVMTRGPSDGGFVRCRDVDRRGRA